MRGNVKKRVACCLYSESSVVFGDLSPKGVLPRLDIFYGYNRKGISGCHGTGPGAGRKLFFFEEEIYRGIAS